MAAFDEKAVHHCEVFCDEAHGGRKNNWYNCKNRRIHKKFLTVKEFGMEHLPPLYRNEEFMDFLKKRIDRTVMITVSYTSEKRPDTYPDSPNPYPLFKVTNSGLVLDTFPVFFDTPDRGPYPGPCPCGECKKSNQPKMEYWVVAVATATHVVFDESEAKNVTVDVFYDSEDREGVRYLYGVGVFDSDKRNYKRDTCGMACVTHEKDLMEKLKSLCYDLDMYHISSCYFRPRILVSHPHGVSKRISIGKALEVTCCVKPGSSYAIDKGTRVSFPLSYDKPEDTQHSDPGGSNDGPPHKKIRHLGDENSKINEVVNPQETVTSRSLEDFSTFLTPKTKKGYVELKVGLKAFPPSGSFIKAHGFSSMDWYTFPKGTKYVSKDGTSVVVPTNIKFYLSNGYRYEMDHFVTYDTATCEGSSGANVDVVVKRVPLGLDSFRHWWWRKQPEWIMDFSLEIF